MSALKTEAFPCPVCHKSYGMHDGKPLSMIAHPIDDIIRRENPSIPDESLICSSCRNLYRTKYIEDVLQQERGELSSLEKEVINSLQEQEFSSKFTDTEFDQSLSFGDRVADRVAQFGGSWRFIISFGAVLVVWIVINSVVLILRPFDPYPFILLNLVLSCLAAMQAPIIMMSQNRQEDKDRARAEHDYQVNLKAEIEIRHLNMKLDLLLNQQWQKLLEIQRLQMEYMEDLSQERAEGKEEQPES